MKKYIFVLTMILAMGLCFTGCDGKKENSKASSSDSSSLADEESEKSSSSVSSEVKISKDNILVGSKSIYLISENENIPLVQLSDKQEYFDSVEINEDCLVAMVSAYDHSSLVDIMFYYVNQELSLEKIDIPEEYSCGISLEGIHNGMIYFRYFSKDYSEDFIGFYNPISKKFNTDSQYTDLKRTVTAMNNYNTVSYSHDVIYQLFNYGKMYLLNTENQNLDIYDENMNVLSSVHLSMDINNFAAIYDTYAIASYDETSSDGKKESYLFYIDLKNGEIRKLVDTSLYNTCSVVLSDNEWLYFYSGEGGDRKGIQTHKYYRVKLSDTPGNPEELCERKMNPMSTDYYNYCWGPDGFKTIGDSFYVILENNDKEEWYKGSLEDKKLEATSIIDSEIPGLEIGRAYVKDSHTDVLDGYEYAVHYYESFRFENIKNADKLNDALMEYEGANGSSEMFGEPSEDIEYLKEYNLQYSDDRTFYEVSYVGENHVALTFSIYEYTGGAHGYGFNSCILFDINEARVVKLKDICPLTEEELKEVIARNSVKFWKEDSEGFFSQDVDSEEETENMYNSFYENGSYNSNFEFENDTAYVVYFPYEYGPFAAGSIRVPIPYSDLGLEGKL